MPSANVGGVAADCRGQQSAVWHARREFELLTLLAHEGDEETRRLFLRLRRQKHLTPPEAKQAAGRSRAKPAPARAQAVPKRKTTAQLARSERNRERLFRSLKLSIARIASTSLYSRVHWDQTGTRYKPRSGGVTGRSLQGFKRTWRMERQDGI